MLTPKKLWRLPIKNLRIADEGYREFGAYMHDIIQKEKQMEKNNQAQNLLSVLVQNTGTPSDEGKVLSDQEIIGNIFIYLIGGHETTYFTPLLN